MNCPRNERVGASIVAKRSANLMSGSADYFDVRLTDDMGLR
jgi:hypothetical protein